MGGKASFKWGPVNKREYIYYIILHIVIIYIYIKIINMYMWFYMHKKNTLIIWSKLGLRPEVPCMFLSSFRIWVNGTTSSWWSLMLIRDTPAVRSLSLQLLTTTDILWRLSIYHRFKPRVSAIEATGWGLINGRQVLFLSHRSLPGQQS